jgi:DNA-binding MarR family transcriptional regulator
MFVQKEFAMSTIDPFEIAQMWHNVMLYTSNPDDVRRYSHLLQRSGAEIRIIIMVRKNPDILIREILDQLNIPKSTLTSILDRLETQKILFRTINKRDRRSYGLELTEIGNCIFNEYMEYQTDIGSKILSVLNEEEQSTLHDLLSKINNKLITE